MDGPTFLLSFIVFAVFWWSVLWWICRNAPLREDVDD